MTVKTSLLGPVRTSLLPYPLPTTTKPPSPILQLPTLPPRSMPLQPPETEEEWYQVSRARLTRGQVVSGGCLDAGPPRPVVDGLTHPLDILMQCAIGKIRRCGHRQCVRSNLAHHQRPKAASTRLRQPTMIGITPPERPTIVPRQKKAVRSTDCLASPTSCFQEHGDAAEEDDRDFDILSSLSAQ